MWRGDGPGGWAKWFASFVEELESGEGYDIGQGDGEEGSEDSVGYENYFFDGVRQGLGDGGGDSGTGGMRLSGEYKGWNVLEAWADRSVRRWHEAGVISDPVVPQPDTSSKLSEDIVPKLANLPNGTGADVPIPVLVEDETSALSEPPAPKATIPTISVTKPPPPAAVDLPTADDILVTSESETPLADADLESGVVGDEVVMREIIIPPSHSAAASPTRATPTERRKPAVSSTPIPRIITSPPPDLVTPLVQPVSDLLEDPAPALPTPTITPSPTVSPVKLPEDDKTVPTKEEDSPVMVSSPDEAEAPEATIRLVGGGGVAGSSEGSQDGVLVSEPEDEPVDVPLSDVPLAEAPLASSTETIKKTDKQEKRSSTASKRFSILSAGKRKKDSVSSTKDAVAL
ncbi:hypothetical protein QCA50_003261 [Cerrena zonata]|uniref:Uncharacterized protein n=1 Tax=Cerrena zonata TaxID=2478898 RepID=A0AAW0GKD6_9APHY